MPTLTRMFLRSSIVYLTLGFSLGAALLAGKGLGYAPRFWSLVSLHVEWLFLGWMLQMAFGMAYMMLPRFDGTRGRPGPAWTAFILHNAALATLGVFQLSAVATPVPALEVIQLVAWVAIVIAAAIFGWGLWRRAGHVPPGLNPG